MGVKASRKPTRPLIRISYRLAASDLEQSYRGVGLANIDRVLPETWFLGER